MGQSDVKPEINGWLQYGSKQRDARINDAEETYRKEGECLRKPKIGTGIKRLYSEKIIELANRTSHWVLWRLEGG